MGRRTWAALLVIPFVASCLLSGAVTAADAQPKDVELDPTRKADRHGVQLPPGAVARLHKLNDRGPAVASRALVFSPDGALLAFIAPDFDTRIWDVKAEKELHRFPHDPKRAPSASSSLVFSTDGKLLISDDGLTWDVATGKTAERFGPAPKLGDWPLMHPTPNPDGKTVLFVTHTGGYEACEVVVFDVATRKEVRRFGKGTRVDGPMVFSADGKTLATAKSPGPVTVPVSTQQGAQPEVPCGVMLWDPATGEKKAEWRSRAWTPIGFSGDAKTLYALGDGNMTAWDVATGKPAREAFGHSMHWTVLMPDRKTLAVIVWQGFALWPIPDENSLGKVERSWTRSPGADPRPMDMAPSPSGRWLAVGETDGTILVWDVAALRKKP